MRQLAGEFKAAREKLAWRQKDLAEKSGVQQCTISRFESGKQTITIETARMLVKALGNSKLDRAVKKYYASIW